MTRNRLRDSRARREIPTIALALTALAGSSPLLPGGAGAAPVAAQTPRSTVNTGGGDDAAGFISANNPWLGAQVGLRLTDSGNFTDILLVSARLMYEIPTGSLRFGLPVMGNVSSLKPRFSRTGTTPGKIEAQIQDVLQSTHGVHAGVYPYFQAIDRASFGLTIHGAVTYKLNALDRVEQANGLPVDSSYVYLHQARIAGGVELFLGPRGEGRYPLTFSLTPAITLLSGRQAELAFGERKSALPQLEGTLIVPIAGGLGILAESIISPDASPAYRAGFLFATELGL